MANYYPMKDQKTLTIFTGSFTNSLSVRRLTINLGWMLSNKYELHLLSNVDPIDRNELEIYYDLHMSTTEGRLGEIKLLKEYLDQYDPDLLWQVTRPPTHGFLLTLFEKIDNRPFIFRYSGDRFNAFKYQSGYKKLLHFGVNNIVGRIPPYVSTANIALGKRGKTQLNQIGVPEGKTKILPPTINSNRFKNLPDSSDILDNSIKDNKNIAFVGRVSYQKGIGLLERTIPKLVRNRPDLNFIFIGEVLDKLDASKQVQSNIQYMNVVSPEDIPKYLAASDLTILPSLLEGVPRVLIESLTAGTPVLARDVGDVPSVTDNLFKTEEQFCDQIYKIERIPLESAEKFYRENMKNEYIEFIESVI